MTKGMLIYIVTMGWTLIVMGGVAYLFKKKKDFTFLNGFVNRSEEEKQYLEKSGYLTALGNLFATSFWLLLITFIAGLLPIPWAFGIGLAIFTLHLMIGLIWVQRYEVPHKRKKMLWIMGLLTAGTIIFVGGMAGAGFIDNKMEVKDDTFEITGMYGDEWKLDDIKHVALLDELPEIKMRTNGFSMAQILKGKFKLEEPYGSGLLFINGRESPYLAVFTDEEFIIISRKEAVETEKIYQELLKRVN